MYHEPVAIVRLQDRKLRDCNHSSLSPGISRYSDYSSAETPARPRHTQSVGHERDPASALDGRLEWQRCDCFPRSHGQGGSRYHSVRGQLRQMPLIFIGAHAPAPHDVPLTTGNLDLSIVRRKIPLPSGTTDVRLGISWARLRAYSGCLLENWQI